MFAYMRQATSDLNGSVRVVRRHVRIHFIQHFMIRP